MISDPVKVTTQIMFLLVAHAVCLVIATGQTVTANDTLRQAAAAYESGDVKMAIRLYGGFVKGHPDAAEVRSNLGAALVRDGQFAPAIEEYRKALEQLPDNPKVRMNLALAYYKLGRHQEAMRGS